MRKVIVKAYGIKREIDLTSSASFMEELADAQDFEIIEYKEVRNEENNKDN